MLNIKAMVQQDGQWLIRALQNTVTSTARMRSSRKGASEPAAPGSAAAQPAAAAQPSAEESPTRGRSPSGRRTQETAE